MSANLEGFTRATAGDLQAAVQVKMLPPYSVRVELFRLSEAVIALRHSLRKLPTMEVPADQEKGLIHSLEEVQREAGGQIARLQAARAARECPYVH